MKVDSVISECIDIFVGAPQGTKLGPLLWLFYINDLQVDNYRAVKYADDTSFIKLFAILDLLLLLQPFRQH